MISKCSQPKSLSCTYLPLHAADPQDRASPTFHCDVAEVDAVWAVLAVVTHQLNSNQGITGAFTVPLVHSTWYNTSPLEIQQRRETSKSSTFFECWQLLLPFSTILLGIKVPTLNRIVLKPRHCLFPQRVSTIPSFHHSQLTQESSALGPLLPWLVFPIARCKRDRSQSLTLTSSSGQALDTKLTHTLGLLYLVIGLLLITRLETRACLSHTISLFDVFLLPLSPALFSVVWEMQTWEMSSHHYSEQSMSWRTLLLIDKEG